MTPISDTPTGRIALVTGGSGFVGGHLIARLLKSGWQVRAIGRSAPRPRPGPDRPAPPRRRRPGGRAAQG